MSPTMHGTWSYGESGTLGSRFRLECGGEVNKGSGMSEWTQGRRPDPDDPCDVRFSEVEVCLEA